MRASRRSLALVTCLACLLAGCGGGGGGGTQSTSTGPRSSGEASLATEAGHREAKPKQPQSSPPEPNPPIASKRTPGAKAVAPDVPVVKGGDNSVQAFGVEGKEREAQQATVDLQSYLEARLAGEWQRACAQTSGEFQRQLSRLVERAKAKDGSEKPKGCPETLRLLLGKASEQALREEARPGRILSFRVRGDGHAYLIYEAGKEVKFVAMASEDGKWKLNVLEPAAFQGSEDH